MVSNSLTYHDRKDDAAERAAGGNNAECERSLLEEPRGDA